MRHRHRARRSPGWGSAWVGAITVLEVAAVVAGWGPPLQPALSVVFLLTVPGFVMIDLGQPHDLPSRVLVGIAGSVAINVVLVSFYLLPSVMMVGAVALIAFWIAQRHLSAVLLRRERASSDL